MGKSAILKLGLIFLLFLNYFPPSLAHDSGLISKSKWNHSPANSNGQSTRKMVKVDGENVIVAKEISCWEQNGHWEELQKCPDSKIVTGHRFRYLVRTGLTGIELKCTEKYEENQSEQILKIDFEGRVENGLPRGKWGNWKNGAGSSFAEGFSFDREETSLRRSVKNYDVIYHSGNQAGVNSDEDKIYTKCPRDHAICGVTAMMDKAELGILTAIGLKCCHFCVPEETWETIHHHNNTGDLEEEQKVNTTVGLGKKLQNSVDSVEIPFDILQREVSARFRNFGEKSGSAGFDWTLVPYFIYMEEKSVTKTYKCEAKSSCVYKQLVVQCGSVRVPVAEFCTASAPIGSSIPDSCDLTPILPTSETTTEPIPTTTSTTTTTTTTTATTTQKPTANCYPSPTLLPTDENVRTDTRMIQDLQDLVLSLKNKTANSKCYNETSAAILDMSRNFQTELMSMGIRIDNLANDLRTQNLDNLHIAFTRLSRLDKFMDSLEREKKEEKRVKVVSSLLEAWRNEQAGMVKALLDDLTNDNQLNFSIAEIVRGMFDGHIDNYPKVINLFQSAKREQFKSGLTSLIDLFHGATSSSAPGGGNSNSNPGTQFSSSFMDEPEYLNLAYLTKTEFGTEFQPKFPTSVQNLVFAKKVCVRNLLSNFYLSVDKDEGLKDGGYSVSTRRRSSEFPLAVLCDWEIVSPHGASFIIRQKSRAETLNLNKLEGSVFAGTDDYNPSFFWEIQLRENARVMTLQNVAVSSEDPSYFLCSVRTLKKAERAVPRRGLELLGSAGKPCEWTIDSPQ